MRHLESLIVLALALVAAAAGLYISAANRDVVTIDLLFWPAVNVRVGLLVVCAFAVGTLGGMLFGTVAALLGSARRRVSGNLRRGGPAS